RPANALDDGEPAASREVHVEQHHVRLRLNDLRDRRDGVLRFAHDVEALLELGAHARQEQAMVVYQEDPRHGARLGSTSRTSVPSPGDEAMVAEPAFRRIRPTMDSAIPR